MVLQKFLTYAAVLGLGAVSVRADSIVFDTFGPGDSYDSKTGYSIGSGFEGGNQFSPSASGVLSKIDVGLNYLAGSHSVDFSLFADSGNAPGTLLESFSATSTGMFGTCCSVLSLTAHDSPLLTAGEKYWLIASSGDDSLSPWNYNSIGVSELRDINGVISLDNAAAFSVFVEQNPVAFVAPSPIPEPSSVALFTMVLSAFAATTVRSQFRRQSGLAIS